MGGYDLTGAGMDATRTRLPVSEQEARFRVEREDRARRNLAVVAVDRYPGDEEGAARWLAEVLDALGLRLDVNPKRRSGFCSRCGRRRPDGADRDKELCQSCAQFARRDREGASRG